MWLHPELAKAGLWFWEKGGKEHQLEARSSGLCPEPELVLHTWAGPLIFGTSVSLFLGRVEGWVQPTPKPFPALTLWNRPPSLSSQSSLQGPTPSSRGEEGGTLSPSGVSKNSPQWEKRKVGANQATSLPGPRSPRGKCESWWREGGQETEIDLYTDPYRTVRKNGCQGTTGDSRPGQGH